MTVSKRCGICLTPIRGSWLTHAATAKHRRAVFRRDHPLGGGRRERKLAFRRHIRKAFTRYGGEEHVKVRRHRRRPPLDGKRKTVDVQRYWRWNGSRNRYRPLR